MVNPRNVLCVRTPVALQADLISCIDFNIGDLKKLISQIRSTEGITQESKQRQEEAVRNVYRFCENTSECRRVQILQHFDERFEKGTCAKGCDTCQENHETVSKDVTTQMLTILRMIQFVNQERKEKVTRNQLTMVLRGSKSAETKSKSFDELPGYGSCKDLDVDLLELILNRLEFLEIIMSASESNKMNFHCEYLIVRVFLNLSLLSLIAIIVGSEGSRFNAGSRTFHS